MHSFAEAERRFAEPGEAASHSFGKAPASTTDSQEPTMKSQGEQTTLLGRTVVGMTALTAVIAVLMVATPSEARTGTDLHTLPPKSANAISA